METATWYRCPNCGHASPDCFDEENAETLAWTPDQVPCDTCGEHSVVLCPHCQHDYDPMSFDRIPVAAGAAPEPLEVAPAPSHVPSWPPAPWKHT